MFPAITSLYAALGGLLMLLLTFSVVARRKHMRIGIGDGGDAVLGRRIRAHGNAVETLPIGLLLLLLLELAGVAAAWLHLAGAVLLTGRALHAWGLSGTSGVSFGRFHGMAMTLLATLGMTLALLVIASLRLV